MRVLFSWLTSQQFFKDISDTDINKNLGEITNQEVEDYVNGLGIMVVNSHDLESTY